MRKGWQNETVKAWTLCVARQQYWCDLVSRVSNFVLGTRHTTQCCCHSVSSFCRGPSRTYEHFYSYESFVNLTPGFLSNIGRFPPIENYLQTSMRNLLGKYKRFRACRYRFCAIMNTHHFGKFRMSMPTFLSEVTPTCKKVRSCENYLGTSIFSLSGCEEHFYKHVGDAFRYSFEYIVYNTSEQCFSHELIGSLISDYQVIHLLAASVGKKCCTKPISSENRVTIGNCYKLVLYILKQYYSPQWR